MNRRQFITTISIAAAGSQSWPASLAARQRLYNGITLEAEWPPRYHWDDLPKTPPYLRSRPDVVNIDVGRQLFVDDFLVESSTLKRVFHEATYHNANPVLVADHPWEHGGGGPAAMPFSDGVFWDHEEKRYKLWYMGGFRNATCFATSQDGIHWTKPSFDVIPGTNIVLNEPRDSCTVWVDRLDPDPMSRYKMALFPIGRTRNPLQLYRSRDGIHWQRSGQAGIAGDRTTCFWNPFRNVWVYSIRSGGEVGGAPRQRLYFETRDFLGQWAETEPVPWTQADSAEPRRDDTGDAPQLYNLDCVAYESLLLGLFSIWRGERPTRPKHNDICVGFSRDGFHWHRPSLQPILSVSERAADWNWGNVQSAGGCCLVVGSQLFFLVSGRGRASSGSDVCSTGLATMRRDGFASMTAHRSSKDMLVTRPVSFSGRYLFVNADTDGGELRVEILDESGKVLAPYSRDAAVPFRGDATCHNITWSGNGDLAALAGRSVRFRFFLTRGHLYAMWVSPSSAGASHGYVGAGGPGLAGPIDTVGQLA